MWFTTALNGHRELVAFHGIQSFEPDNGAHLSEQDRLKSLLQSLSRFYQNSLGAKAFGCVHGWLAQAIRPEITAMGGVHMAMLRHPILRVNSLFFRELEHFNPLNIDAAEIFEVLATRHRQYAESNFQHDAAPLEAYAQKFSEQCRSVVKADHWDLLNIPTGELIQFEKITSDREYFRERFECIAQGCRRYVRENPKPARPTLPEFSCSPEYVESVFALDPINRKAKKYSEADALPEDIFARWPAAFRLLFVSALKANGGHEMVKLYESFGYRLPITLHHLPHIQ